MKANQSVLKDFILVGFSSYPHVRTFLFVLFFGLYLLTLTGNLAILGLTWVDRSLHTPMYLFLRALSFSETCYTLTIIPKMLADLLTEKRSISVPGCGLQMCFFLGLGGTNCIILTLMGYDRFLAICHPLRYPLYDQCGVWAAGGLCLGRRLPNLCDRDCTDIRGLVLQPQPHPPFLLPHAGRGEAVLSRQ